MARDDKKRKHKTFNEDGDDNDDADDVVDKVEKKEKEDKKEETNGEGEKDGAGEGGGEEQTTKRKRKRKRKKKNDSASKDESNSGDNKDGGSVNKLDSLEHTVYVEGIPFDCTEEEVKGFFVDGGCDDVLQMRLPRWQDSGRLRGYGHIVFDTTESKSKALNQLNGQNLKNRYLNIQEAKPSGSGGGTSSNAPREQPADCRTVFVKNLPYNNITEDTILHVFRSCGKIVDGGVRLARNYQTKQLKGFGYIEFKNPEGAYSAVQRASKADGIKVGGRMCFVDYEESAMKGSFKTADGKSWQKTHGSAHSNNNGYSNSRNQSRRY